MKKDESPNYLETPKKGKGVRRLNSRPVMIFGGLVLLAMSAISYTYFDRLQAQTRTREAAQDQVKVPTVATSPVSRPAGPDVSMPPAPPYAPFPQEDGAMPVAHPQESEAMRRARDERIASYRAALASKMKVSGFGRETATHPVPGDRVDDGLRMPHEEDGPIPDGDINRQREKKEFLNSFDSNQSPYLKHTRKAPLSSTEIKAGSIIPGVMISGVNSDLPGQIIGQVRQNVYDSATGRHLLIPAGAKIIGTYDSSVSAGQERVLVAWNRIIFPDSSSIMLDTMPGADVSGYAGFHEKVDNHYWRTFGNAFLLSLFSAGIQLSQPRGAVTGTYNSQQIMAAELGRQLGRLGMQLTQRNLNIQPTLEISPGYQFSVMVTKDMILPPWKGN